MPRRPADCDTLSARMRWAVLWILLIGLVLLPFLLFEQQFNAFAEHITRDGTSKWLVASAVFALLARRSSRALQHRLHGFGCAARFRARVGRRLDRDDGRVPGRLRDRSQRIGAARRFIGDDGIRRASALMQRYGELALVLCRPVPVLAEASVVFAGLVRANYGRFVRLTAVSNLGIAAGYAAVGAFSRRLDSYSFLIAFVGALLLPGLSSVSRKTYGRTEN